MLLILLDLSTIKKYDTHGMHMIYDEWPTIACKSYESNKDKADFKNIEHVVFCGMGGSGTICDIFSAILSKSHLHVCVVKGYHLPKTVDANTLVVFSSVSGDTNETLDVLKQARKTNAKLVGFASGGKMEKYCTKNKIPFTRLTQVNSPRASLPIFLYSMLSFFEPIIGIGSKEVNESMRFLHATKKSISTNNLAANNQSLNLANWMKGIPMIYYPWGLQAAAIRFKNSLQENIKTHAMAEDIMEASHNGIVAWEKPSKIQPILIRGTDDFIKTKERWDIFKEYFIKNNIEYKEIVSVKGNILSKLINLIYLLDYSTVYKAILLKTDPTPITSINFIKKRLK